MGDMIRLPTMTSPRGHSLRRPNPSADGAGDAGGDDANVGQGVVAGRQEGGLDQTAAVATVAGQQEGPGEIDRQGAQPGGRWQGGVGKVDGSWALRMFMPRA